jgi:hypothetical protein
MCPVTSVKDYHSPLRYTPEEGTSQTIIVGFVFCVREIFLYRDGAFGVSTRYWLDGSGLAPRWKQEAFFSPYPSKAWR